MNPPFPGSKQTLRRTLKEMGFKYGRLNEREYVMQRPDIVAHRAKFLKIMRKNRQSTNPLPVIYLDETWFDCNDTIEKSWFKPNLKTPEERIQYSTRKGTHVGKGGRIIIVHAGGARGFVDGALMAKSTKKETDLYSRNMDFNSFRNWFRILLETPTLMGGAHIIVYDNAPFHAQDNLPKSNSRKAEYITFLNAVGVEATEDDLLIELKQKVQAFKTDSNKVIDNMARAKGHTPVRLPPYHCKSIIIEAGLKINLVLNWFNKTNLI